MKKGISIILFLGIFAVAASAQKKLSPKKDYLITLETTLGDIVLVLYDATPLHKANFVKLAKKNYYKDVLFHRVIKEFMIQAGDPDSKTAKKGELLGKNSYGELIPAEFDERIFHKRGVLAAARDNNPEKASSGSQFYIVQGKTFTDAQLDLFEKRDSLKFDKKKRDIYKTIGGTPHLDQKYTAYGEVVQGMEVVDKIAEQKTDANNRPIEDIRIKKVKVKALKRSKIKEKYGYEGL